jgi:hypothetical protein
MYVRKSVFSFFNKRIFSSRNNFFKIQKLNSSVYVNHRDTIDNNDDTPFDFTPENYKKIEEILVI